MLPQNELLRYLQQLPLFAGDEPPLTNRGVIDPTSPLVFSHLDYIACHWEAPRKFDTGLMTIPGLNDWLSMLNETNGVKHYRYGATLFPAGRMYWNRERDKLPGYIVLSGADLGLMRSTLSITDDDIVKQLNRWGRGFTRLDFAVNIDRGHPRECFTEWLAHRRETRIKRVRVIMGEKKADGYSAYFGSPSSERLVRVYDKAAELKVSDATLTRIEQQIRKEPADRLARQMVVSGVVATGKASIRKFINFPALKWWNDAMEGEDIPMQLKPQKETSFARWLHEQVLPAIQKRIEAGQETEAITTFTKELLKLHGDLGGSG